MPHAKNKIPTCDNCELCSFTVLKSLSTQDLADVSNSKTNLFIPKGQRIFSEGNMPNGLYALYSGKVKVHKNPNENSEQYWPMRWLSTQKKKIQLSNFRKLSFAL